MPAAVLLASALVALAQNDTSNWYTFAPKNDFGPSVIGMADWFDGPAGKHGGVRMRGNRFVFEDGTPVKFWGINHGNTNNAPPLEVALIRAQRLQKYGINAVRFHKFTYGSGGGFGDPVDSTKLTEEGWTRLDNYVHELKKRGIYHGWSHIFGHQLQPGDRKRVLAYDEVVNAQGGFLKGSTYGLVNFAPDLQDLVIELTVNMLKHRNPKTGLTYAQEPSLAFIELQNEDNIFFPTTQNAIEKAPTYKRLIEGMFSDWLRRKYGTEEKLVKAWGPRALNAYPEFQKDESLAARNIYPIAHYWWYGHQGLEDQTRNKGVRQRLLDSAEFLHETQNRFYRRFVDAIRKAGYRGPLVGSPWQAGDNISHYYNLRSDALVGVVDRHNYFGGGDSPMKPGPFDNSSMLGQPGSGLLSTGMQQVAGHPFQLSEWIGIVPNEWLAEGTPIIAAYGLGLQGWDASYHFANDLDRFSDTLAIRDNWGIWNVDSPTQLGLYPAVARMVLRKDVAEGKLVHTRNVSLDDLRKGQLGFREDVEQRGDVKSIKGDVPLEALAVGRVEVAFNEKSKPTPPADLSRFVSGNTTRSTTGQLSWTRDGAGKGFFTIDTAGTKALVGFAPSRSFDLGGVQIRTDNPFATIFVTSLQKDRSLRDARSALITVMARARNTGMRYSADGKALDAVGTAPIILEPVRASITLNRPARTVNILDHDGRRTGRSLPVKGRSINLDGATDKTMYYEVVY
jgi:hypothetical protein